MKMKKLKVLAVGMGMLGATSAHAIMINEDNITGGLGTGSGLGDLFLSVWDAIGNRSFAFDLNTSFNAFLPTAGTIQSTSFTHPDLTNFINTTANPSALRYTVAAISNSFGPGLDDATQLGVLTTSSDVITEQQQLGPTQGGLVGVAQTVIRGGAYSGELNSNSPPGDTVLITDPEDLAFHGNLLWEDDWGNQFDFNANALLGEDALFYFINVENTPNGQFDQTRFERLAGVWNLTGSGLTYSVVPIPAAVWLLGSALLGLATIGRRRV